MIRFSFGMMVHAYPEISGLKVKTKKQEKALGFVLGNIWKYGTESIYFHFRNQCNFPERYNPSLIGNKPVRAVLYALRGLGLIEIEKGIPKFTYDDNWEDVDPTISSFTATQAFYGDLRRTIPSELFFELPPFYIQYKDLGDHLLNFEWCDFTKRIFQEIAEYCSFMQEQSLVVDGEPLSEYQVIRTFRDWAGDGSFLYGGRGFHPVMRMKKAQRSRILINGRKTVALDYPASEPNILYQMMTGKRLSPDGDPYQVDGLDRSEVKPFFTIMLNTAGAFGAAKAITNWLDDHKVKDEEKAPVLAAIKRFGSAKAVIEAIVDRNKPIASCLMQGKAMGQHYQWLEANLVFHVAHQLSLRGVPAITVHDEFIVMEKDKDIAEQLMYSEWPKDLPVLAAAPWNRRCETQSGGF